MPAAKAVLAVVREWIVKAENDLLAAAQILKLGKAAPLDTADARRALRPVTESRR